MNILLAYDGTDYTGNALDYSISMAKAFGGKLHILSVMADATEDLDAETHRVDEYLESAKAKAEAAGVTADIIIEVGKACQMILETAEKMDVGTLVVGRSNKSLIDGFRLGSVSECVVKNAGCTVIVVQ